MPAQSVLDTLRWHRHSALASNRYRLACYLPRYSNLLTCRKNQLILSLVPESGHEFIPMSDPESLLRECVRARTVKNLPLCMSAARSAIASFPHVEAAWRELAWALFELRRYREAGEAARSALLCRPAPGLSVRTKLKCFIRASRLLNDLSDHIKNESPTAASQAGWYADRLEELVDGGNLDPFIPKFREGQDPDIMNLASLTDCALIYRADGRYDKGWYYTSHTRDGGGRNVAPSVLRGFPLDQATGGYIYLKDGIFSLGCECYDEGRGPCTMCIANCFPIPSHRFPSWPVAPISPISAPGGVFLDIQVCSGLVPGSTQSALSTQLGNLAEKRGQSPAPMYLNIIDPNVGAVNETWVPTEFQTSTTALIEVAAVLDRACRKATGGKPLPPGFLQRACKLEEDEGPALAQCEVRSPIPDLDPHKYSKLYVAVEKVLEAALPLLARLRLPSLLLPGPLQAVVKAQRIVLGEGEVYSGVWHEDGLREHVVAVVLFYYKVSPCLEGGAIEFASKQKSMMQLGDEQQYYEMNETNARKLLDELPRCKVPISEGTLLVFGNYAAVHRVLPMKAVGKGGSRDFLAFFIIDQREPLLVPRDLGPRSERLKRRGELLCKQLQPRGRFCLDKTQVYSAGNGSVTDVAWLSKGEHIAANIASCARWASDERFREVSAVVSRMNMTPPVLGRGSSYLCQLEGQTAHFNAESAWTQIIIGDQRDLVVFLHNPTNYFRSEPPGAGVVEVHTFASVTDWEQDFYWTHDEELTTRINELRN